jgi:hypothetical protein
VNDGVWAFVAHLLTLPTVKTHLARRIKPAVSVIAFRENAGRVLETGAIVDFMANGAGGGAAIPPCVATYPA